MPDLNIGQQGTLRSIPKITRINGDDRYPVVYRNMGNNHAYPFIFAGQISGGADTYTVMSGVKLHGMEVASYSMVTVGGTVGTAPYVTKDTAANTVSITTAASGTVDYMVMVGLTDYSAGSEDCRGNTGAVQSLP